MTNARYAIAGAVLLLLSAVLWVALPLVRTSGKPSSASGASGDDVTLQFYRDPKPVPSFALTTLDGRTLTSDGLRGKVVLINFWATWCPPCRAEIPDLIALQKKYADQLVVLGVSTDEEPPAYVQKFVDEFKINYPIAMSTPAIERAFPGVSGLPTSFVVDPQGRIVQKHVGLLNAAMTEQETRALAGLTVNAKIEHIDPDKPIGLANAAQAREIPGVDLASLKPEHRREALLKLNEDGCTCGCGLSVARCRVEDPTCSVSLPLARSIVDELVAAKN